MITVLTWLTVGYAVVLVLVLAATLITVLWALWSIGTGLGRIKAALVEVDRNVQPLESVVVPVNEGLQAVATGLVAARDHLAATDTHLAGLVPAEAPSPIDAPALEVATGGRSGSDSQEQVQ